MISKDKLLKTHVAFSAITTVITIAVVVFCYIQGLFVWADNFLYDINYKWRGPQKPDSRIVLVLMDKNSSIELKRMKESWSRSQLAQGLRNLCSAGAEIIGLDMIFMARDPIPGADSDLASAMDSCGNIVLARTSATHGGELTSLPIFQDVMIGDGFIDVPLDREDDILRRMRFLNAKPLPDGTLQLFPSFPLELVRTFLNIDFEFDFSDPENLILGEKGGKQLRLPYPELIINYPGDFTVFPALSYADVVLNRFSPETVRGKLVIVGSSLATEKDIFNTSYTRFSRHESGLTEKFGEIVGGIGNKDLGVACHAHAANTILSGKFIHKIKKEWILPLIALFGILGLLFHVPKIEMVFEFFILLFVIFSIIIGSHFFFLKKLLWIDTAPLITVFVFQLFAGITLQKTMSRKRTAMVTNLFGKYVSPDVVDELIQGKMTNNLDGRSTELSILFSDLRGFTSISESLGARDTGRLLNVYFGEMIPIVFQHKGTLDKLMGDAVMAFFGAPIPLPDHGIMAAETAITMLERIEALRKRTDIPGIDRLRIGIGLNQGTVTVGNLGSIEFMDYTIVGDAVNLASRLEGLTKYYNIPLIVSEFLARSLDDRFLTREIDTVRVKGKGDAVTLFQLMGWRNQGSGDGEDIAAEFESGIAAYREMKWDTARKRFLQVLRLSPGDGPSRLYLNRIEEYKKHPPGMDWDAITTFDHK